MKQKSNKFQETVKKIVPALLMVWLLIAATDLIGCSSSDSSDDSSDESYEIDAEYTDRDCDPSYDDATATHITLSGTTATTDNSTYVSIADGVVTLKVEATYVLTGDYTGQIVVACGTQDKVQVVLKNANITNPTGPAIFIKTADKVFLTIDEGTTNTIADGTTYTTTEDDNGSINAAIFSKADLTINGAGTLNVTGNYAHAIRSKDDLVITGGTFNITSVEDAIKGKDCVKIKDGVFTINAGDDGINTKQYILIDGGTFNIAKCYEGIEGEKIYINGGNIAIYASDDALNATSKATESETTNDPRSGGGNMAETGMQAGNDNCLVQINGGTLYAESAGDTIDSNGSVSITGGTVMLMGPVSDGDATFDYDLESTITGGTVIMLGSSGMAQNFTSGTQPFTFTQVNGSAGSVVYVTDASGNTLISMTATKNFEVVQTSCASYTEGGSYTLHVGGTTTTITASTTASGGLGGLGGDGNPMAAGQGGSVQKEARGGNNGMNAMGNRSSSSAQSGSQGNAQGGTQSSVDPGAQAAQNGTQQGGGSGSMQPPSAR